MENNNQPLPGSELQEMLERRIAESRGGTQQPDPPQDPPEVPPSEPIVDQPTLPVTETPLPEKFVFANPLVERFDTLARGGAPPEVWEKVFRLSRTSIDDLDPESAIRTMFEFKNPKHTAEEIQAKMEDLYGVADERTALQRFDLSEADQAAKAYLKEQKVSLETYRGEEQQQQEMRITKLTEQWRPVVAGIVGTLKAVNTQVKYQDFEYEGTFNLSPEGQQEVNDALIQFAVENNVPYTVEGRAKLIEVQDRMIWARDGKKINESSIKDAYSKGYEAAKREGAALPEPESKQTPAAPTDTLAMMKQDMANKINR